MELNDIFKKMREIQNIKQNEIAFKLNVTPAAINQYETARTKLAKETLSSYAKLINMDPKFLESQEGNPFLSKDLIKIFFPERAGFIDFTPLDLLFEVNQCLELLFLLEEKGPIEKLFSKTMIEKPIYAIAVNDHKNLYIMKRKSGNIVGTLDISATLTEKALKEKKKIRYLIINIEKDFYRRIRSWNDLNKNDIKSLFEKMKPLLT